MKKTVLTLTITLIFHYFAFADMPDAYAGNDTLFCGNCGTLNAIPSVGTGTWSSSHPEYINFEDANDPNTQICTNVYNSGNQSIPHFYVIWTEATEVISDSDTIIVQFIQEPNSEFIIMPPRCRSERFEIIANNDSLPNYYWNFYNADIDSMPPANNFGANYRYFLTISENVDENAISLYTVNQWGCESNISIDTVFNPIEPQWNYSVINDYCNNNQGAIIMEDTIDNNVFYLMNEQFEQILPGTFNSAHGLGGGEYNVRARYPTENEVYESYYLATYGDAMCTDTININILPINPEDVTFIYPEICMVSTTFENCNLISWDKANYPQIDTFFVFRADADNVYDNIGFVSANETSVFYDCSASPHLQPYKYILSSNEYCVTQEQFDKHSQSVSLSFISDDFEQNVLSWNTYFGDNEIISIDVLRGSIPEDMNVLATVSVDDTEYYDDNPVDGFVYYKIRLHVAESCSSAEVVDVISSNIATNNEDFHQYNKEFSYVNKMSIFPNPAKDYFSIDSQEFPFNLNVFDLQGRTVLSIYQYNGEKVNLSSVPAGIYILQIELNSSLINYKLIVH